MSERIITFPASRIFRTMQTISGLLERIKGVRPKLDETDLNPELPIDFKLRLEAKRRPQMLRELGKSWAWARTTGFGTNTFDSKEVEVRGGKLIVYTNLDPRVWQKPKRGIERWQKSQLRVVE